ncbi:SMC-Scp complex subunit ScpB [Rhodanobacter soli]|uniref:SMC-Scp complex subunit ScpB n=1 Tax=Rhodanobacter soli TaxID=590609 RepID=UPI0031D7B131
MQIEQLKPIIEAALLASTQPMTVQQLGDLFNEADDVNREQIAKALEALAGDCDGRGIELKEVASGFRYQVRQDVHPWISRMWTERPSRYSRALLETLALIAYRQPITRPEIEQIRGVVVSSNIIKTMEEREWIRVVGYRDMPGKPALFGTTRAFLDYFNLKSLDQLPPLSEIRDMEDPQLRFEPDPLPARIVRDLPIDPDEEAPADADGSTTNDTEYQASADAADADDSDITTAADAPVTSESDEAGPDPSLPAETLTTTADEAANPAADVEPDTAEQDPEEYRA